MDLEIEGEADNERPGGKRALFGGGRASKLNIVPRDEMPRLSVSPFDFQSNCLPD